MIVISSGPSVMITPVRSMINSKIVPIKAVFLKMNFLYASCVVLSFPVRDDLRLTSFAIFFLYRSVNALVRPAVAPIPPSSPAAPLDITIKFFSFAISVSVWNSLSFSATGVFS